MTPKIDKVEALIRYLEEHGVKVKRGRSGYQQISCINQVAHPRGDRKPSASIDLTKGRYRCFACDLHGDVFDLLKAEKSLTYSQALATLKVTKSLQDSEEWNTWL